jgi:hypothetical protein
LQLGGALDADLQIRTDAGFQACRSGLGFGGQRGGGVGHQELLKAILYGNMPVIFEF